MDLITSLSNPKIKQVRSLKQRKGRQETGLFVVEGIRPVGEAAAASEAAASAADISLVRVVLDSIYYSPAMLSSEFGLQLVAAQAERGVPCFSTSPEVFASMVEKENPQGLLALVSIHQPDLSQLNPDNFPWGVALVSPQDPGNLGSILRTIDAVGASGLLLLENSTDPYHPACVRASMGAVFWVPVVSASFEEFTSWAQEHAYAIYGTSAHAELDYRQAPAYPRPLVLLLGSERQGLTPSQSAVCTQAMRLPMFGRATSLNLAVAAGILLYDILGRQ